MKLAILGRARQTLKSAAMPLTVQDPVPQGDAKFQAVEFGALTKIWSSKCPRPAEVQVSGILH